MTASLTASTKVKLPSFSHLKAAQCGFMQGPWVGGGGERGLVILPVLPP